MLRQIFGHLRARLFASVWVGFSP